jgi:hypothetical protein
MQDFYTYHIGLVLDNSAEMDSMITEWKQENLLGQSYHDAVEDLAKWLKEIIAQAVDEATEGMPDGLGKEIVIELLDFPQTNYRTLAKGYLENYERQTEQNNEPED